MAARNKEMHYRNHELERINVGHYHFYIKSTQLCVSEYHGSRVTARRESLVSFFLSAAFDVLFEYGTGYEAREGERRDRLLDKNVRFWGSHTKIRNGAI